MRRHIIPKTWIKNILSIFLSLLLLSFMNMPLYGAPSVEGKVGDTSSYYPEEPKDDSSLPYTDSKEKGILYPEEPKDAAYPPEPDIDKGPFKEGPQPEYVEGEIIVKIKKDSLLVAVFGRLLENGQDFVSITGTDELDKFFAKNPVSEATNVFPGFSDRKITPQNGIISILEATSLRDQAIEFSNRKIEEIKKRFSSRTQRAPENAEISFLESIYRVKFKNKKVDVMSLCNDLQSNREIEYAQPNYKMVLSFEPNDTYYDSDGSWDQDYDDLYALKEGKLNCGPAWDIARGEGIVVAVIDTGVDYRHGDLADNIWINTDEVRDNDSDDDDNGLIDDWHGYDFSDEDNDPSDDYHGHGTHCAGTIAAIGNNDTGVIGVAPDAKIMPVKMYPNASSDVCVQAIEYAASMGADVLSNSWGPDGRLPRDPVLEEVIDYAYNLGCVVVFAAGNDRDDVQYYSPANYSKTIAVAATEPNDERASFSQFGMAIDVASPGVGILSLRAEETDMYGNGRHIVDDDYYWANGTSMACPHVAGLIALILSNNPDFSNEEVKQVLRVSADDLGDEGFDIFYGHGRINANEALQIESVCSARIDSPRPKTYSCYELGVIEITGTASGENFQNYRLFRTVNVYENEWVQIGDVHEEEVIDDVLGELDMRMDFEEAGFCLKLVVTDNDDNTFEDIVGKFIITPWGITTVEDLQNMRDFLSVSYYLTNNINASDTANWNDGAGFDPIGDFGVPFVGTFNGNGHIIRGLTIDRVGKNHVGLFGAARSSVIQNVGLVNVNITGGNQRIAGLVGYVTRKGTINNCYVTGNVTGARSVGGLVGDEYGYNTAVVNCYSTADVTGNNSVGGLIGSDNNGLTISNCYATGDVVANRGEAGGLVGTSGGIKMTNCYATGNVTGDSNAGGLLGRTYIDGTFMITNCYAAGHVTGHGDYVGGFIGYPRTDYNPEQYSNNFWDIDTTGCENGLGGNREIEGITGLSTDDMMQEDNYPHREPEEDTLEGWDFTNIWYMSNRDNDYPHLRDGAPSGFGIYNIHQLQGIQNNPHDSYFLCNDIDAEETEGWNDGAGFDPIGEYTPDRAFTGIFDGNGHVIRNLYVNRRDEDYVGLFVVIYQGAVIQNLGLVDVDIRGRNSVGSLVAENITSSITNSYATGNVHGSRYVGGLVGKNRTSSINNSYATGNVCGEYYLGGLAGESKTSSINNSYAASNLEGVDSVGGLVGQNWTSSINNSYATGNVSGRRYAGGLVGLSWISSSINNSYATSNVEGGRYTGGLTGGNYDNSPINNSYAAGRVESDRDSVGGLIGHSRDNSRYAKNYYDIEATGQEHGIQGEDIEDIQGRDTEEMMQGETFEGWNFNEVWCIDEGRDYPRHQWVPQEQTIELREDWNIISFYVEPSNMSMVNILHSLIEEDVLLQIKDEAGHFISPQYDFDNIGNMSITEGYQIKVSEDATFYVEGTAVRLPIGIPLRQGWNMIGYPCQVEQDARSLIETSLEDIAYILEDEDRNFINSEDQRYDIDDLYPGKGYKMWVSEDVTLFITEPE